MPATTFSITNFRCYNCGSQVEYPSIGHHHSGAYLPLCRPCGQAFQLALPPYPPKIRFWTIHYDFLLALEYELNTCIRSQYPQLNVEFQRAVYRLDVVLEKSIAYIYYGHELSPQVHAKHATAFYVYFPAEGDTIRLEPILPALALVDELYRRNILQEK